ncbi:MAG: hypothetical protein PF795_05505 [Kiritimatiellae bacterium]|jgi:hypothetical protein|nr:hypothetical protein [Kiritimatiellia bacterium]
MKNHITVDGALILESYCILRQLERGIDAATKETWTEFCDYYRSKDMSRVDRFVDTLRDLCPDPIDSTILDKEEAGKKSSLPFINRFRSKHTMPMPLLQGIKKFLDEFSRLLSDGTPSDKELVDRMTQAANLRSDIELRYRGMKGLTEANCVEHYFRNDMILSYSIDEIMQIYAGSK